MLYLITSNIFIMVAFGYVNGAINCNGAGDFYISSERVKHENKMLDEVINKSLVWEEKIGGK